MTYCKQCLEKQRRINELEEEIASLKHRLRYQEQTAQEGFFGSSTPSSKRAATTSHSSSVRFWRTQRLIGVNPAIYVAHV